MTPETEAERRRAFRALLRNPLLQATGEKAEEFTLVRRHSEWLKNWLSKFPAWSLHLNKDVARLCKIPADLLDGTRPAIDRTTGTTFTRRRYAMLCFALAALERMDRQTTLGQVAQAIMRRGRLAGTAYENTVRLVVLSPAAGERLSACDRGDAA